MTNEKIAKPCASPDIGLYRYDNTNSSFPRKRESTTIALGLPLSRERRMGAVEFRNFLMTNRAYITVSGAAGALPSTTALASLAMLSCLPLFTSSQAMNAVQPIVRAKIKPRHQGSHFRPTLHRDSRSGPYRVSSSESRRCGVSSLDAINPLLIPACPGRRRRGWRR